MALPVLWDPELAAAEVRRVAAKGCHSITFTENPATLGYPSFHDGALGPAVEGGVRRGRRGVHPPRLVGPAGGHGARTPPVDVMITLQPMNICQAAADLLWSRVIKEFPDIRFALSEGGTGWIPYFLDRLDRTYDMHHLWTGSGLRRPAAERRLPRALPDLLHRRPGRHRAAAPDRHRQHRLGVRLPALGLVVARGAARSWRAWRPACPTTSWPRSATRTPAAGTPSTRSPTGRGGRSTVGALRAEAAGHDVSIRSFDKGRFERTHKGIDMGDLAKRATA